MVMQMAQFRHFQATVSLPIIQEMAPVTQLSSAAALREVQAKRPEKRKAYTAFTPDQGATIGKDIYTYIYTLLCIETKL